MQGYCDVYKWTILKWTSPEVKCLHPTSSRREMCTSSVSNVIYHKFSHGAAFYTLIGKNVTVMLELIIYIQETGGFCSCYPTHISSCIFRHLLFCGSISDYGSHKNKFINDSYKLSYSLSLWRAVIFVTFNPNFEPAFILFRNMALKLRIFIFTIAQFSTLRLRTKTINHFDKHVQLKCA